MLALSSWARICLNIVFVLRSMCLGAFLACLCLDPCVYVLFSMFMPRSTCLSVHCHACGQIYIFECFMPCSCVQIYMLVAMPYASKAFLSLVISFFLCFGPFGRVQIQILWTRPTSIHLGLYQRVWIISFTCVYVCLLASMLYIRVCLSRSRLCHDFVPFVGLCLSVYGSLAYVVASVIPRVCLDVITCEIHLCGVSVLDSHLSLLYEMFICLPCLLCATHLAFFASLHLCTLAYMIMHKFVCRTYSNPMKLWTLDPNLHLFSQDTFFCLIACSFAPSCA